MMLQVPWGTSSPTGVSKGTINKEHFSCTPVVPSESPRGPNKDQHKCGILIARIKLNTYFKKKPHNTECSAMSGSPGSLIKLAPVILRFSS